MTAVSRFDVGLLAKRWAGAKKEKNEKMKNTMRVIYEGKKSKTFNRSIVNGAKTQTTKRILLGIFSCRG